MPGEGALHRDELTAVGAAIARRYRGAANGVVSRGPFSLDLTAKTLRVSGRAVHLTRQEYTVLETMLMRDRVQTKENLMDALYGAEMGDTPEIKIIDVK